MIRFIALIHFIKVQRRLGFLASGLLVLLALGLSFSSHLEAQVSVTGTNNPVVEKNNYIVRFSPNTGSYSLYKREIGKNRLVRLINDRQPRSTYVALALNGRVYTLGRSSRYLASRAERLTLLTDGGMMLWKLPQRIRVKYYLRILSETSLTSYIRLNIVVENTSSITQSVGLFHMFDVANNNLGLPAFSLPDGDVFRETILESIQVPYYVRTSYNAYFYLDVRGSTRPDRVILANWTKLHEAGWNYGFQLNSQGFGYNLYDSNNPALGVYYDARPLPARQSRNYVLYIAFDAIPRFSNFNEFDDVQVLNEPIDDSPVVETPPEPPAIQAPAPQVVDNSVNTELLVQLIKERQQPEPVPDVAPEIRYLPDIDIEALYALYHSEDKRYEQLKLLENNLRVSQEQQQKKLQQISPYRKLHAPEERLQLWEVQQRRLAGQLDNWNTFLINILELLPERLRVEPEMIKLHNNLRDLRLALRETSEQWTPLIQRIRTTWHDWEEGLVGEPAKRLSNSLYKAQQELIPYMNELSDLARYVNGVQQRLEAPLTPLYGEMSITLLISRQNLEEVNSIVELLYADFSKYSQQALEQIGFKSRLQNTIFINGQQLDSNNRDMTSIGEQLDVAYNNIRLLEDWQEHIDLHQTRLAYDPYRKEREIKELLQQIGRKIDESTRVLEGTQKGQNQLQSELNEHQTVQILRNVAWSENPEAPEAQEAPEANGLGLTEPATLENAAWQPALPNVLLEALQAVDGSKSSGKAKNFKTGPSYQQQVQLVNPYPYEVGESTPRNKMSDTVRPRINEDELYNALEKHPADLPPPLLPPRQQTRRVEEERLYPELLTVRPPENINAPGINVVESPTPQSAYIAPELAAQLNAPARSLKPQYPKYPRPSDVVTGTSNPQTEYPRYPRPSDVIAGTGNPQTEYPKYPRPIDVIAGTGNPNTDPIPPSTIQDSDANLNINGAARFPEVVTGAPNPKTDPLLITESTGTGLALNDSTIQQGPVGQYEDAVSSVLPDSPGTSLNLDQDITPQGFAGQYEDSINAVIPGSPEPLPDPLPNNAGGGSPSPGNTDSGNGWLIREQQNESQAEPQPEGAPLPERGVPQRSGAIGPDAYNGSVDAAIAQPELASPGDSSVGERQRELERRAKADIIGDPYRDVKNFIKDVDVFIKLKDFTDYDVDKSQHRWSGLEDKYHIDN